MRLIKRIVDVVMARAVLGVFVATAAIGGMTVSAQASCPGDYNNDGHTDVDDLLHLIGGWGSHGYGYHVGDLLTVLSYWENCSAEVAPSTPLRFLHWEHVAESPAVIGGAPSKTYRLYAMLEPGASVQAVYGSPGVWDSQIRTKGEAHFYQNSFGGASSQDINPGLFEVFPDLQWDSFATIGKLGNTDNALLFLGMDWHQFEHGGDALHFDNGLWFVTTGDAQGHIDEHGRVLLAQLTILHGTGNVYSDIDVTLSILGHDSAGNYWTERNVKAGPVHTVCASGCHFTSVQGAIDHSSDGDTVFIHRGVYHEVSINPHGKNIRIVGERIDGDDQHINTQIWPTVNGNGIVCNSHEDFNTVISNLVIRQAHGVDVGGGMLCENGSSPRIKDCIFYENYATHHGGGIYAEGGSHPMLVGCQFHANHPHGLESDATSSRGSSSELLTIMDCTICDNEDAQVVGPIHAIGGNNHIHSQCSLGGILGDINGDGVIDHEDVAGIHAEAGLCHHDTNHDGETDVADLLEVIAGWHQQCP